jgi:hypothetical protein
MSNVTFDTLTAKYGSYTKDGIDYAITQNPYLDYVAGSSTAYVVNGETYYFAQGYDREGNHVRLIWEITNTETEDESEACDWDEFTVEPRGGDFAPWSVTCEECEVELAATHSPSEHIDSKGLCDGCKIKLGYK